MQIHGRKNTKDYRVAQINELLVDKHKNNNPSIKHKNNHSSLFLMRLSSNLWLKKHGLANGVTIRLNIKYNFV